MFGNILESKLLVPNCIFNESNKLISVLTPRLNALYPPYDAVIPGLIFWRLKFIPALKKGT